MLSGTIGAFTVKCEPCSAVIVVWASRSPPNLPKLPHRIWKATHHPMALYSIFIGTGLLQESQQCFGWIPLIWGQSCPGRSEVYQEKLQKQQIIRKLEIKSRLSKGNSGPEYECFPYAEKVMTYMHFSWRRWSCNLFQQTTWVELAGIGEFDLRTNSNHHFKWASQCSWWIHSSSKAKGCLKWVLHPACGQRSALHLRMGGLCFLLACASIHEAKEDSRSQKFTRPLRKKRPNSLRPYSVKQGSWGKSR